MKNPLRRSRYPKKLTLGEEAEMGLREAVAEAIEEHRIAGNPIAVYRSGQVVIVPPDQIKPLAEKRLEATRAGFRASHAKRNRERAKGKVRDTIAARKIGTRD
jgi:hypothetical protein